MLKHVAALEITSLRAKFAVGALIGEKPSLLYYAEKPLPCLVSRGKIVDKKAIGETISSFSKLSDEDLHLKIDTEDISLVLPPIGFEVYQSNKTTNVVSSESNIEVLDISNVMSLVRKENIPNGDQVVDIVPDCFLTEEGSAFFDPPIGRKSNSLTIHAKVHTVPEELFTDYQLAVQEGGYRVKRVDMAPYCASQLIASDPASPKSYFLVDMGEALTTVSFVGEKSLYATFVIGKGSRRINEAIMEDLGLSFDEAEALKCRYGYSVRSRLYRPNLRVDPSSSPLKGVSQEKLNASIERGLSDYFALISNAIDSLIKKQAGGDAFLNYPVIYTGGGSKLNGLDILLKKNLPSYRFIHYTPMVLGARNPSATNVLGLIYIGGAYRGTLEDHYHGVSALTREKGE